MAICGHLWGFAITATTAIPDAVLIGLAVNKGWSLDLKSSGIADIISTNFGILGH